MYITYEIFPWQKKHPEASEERDGATRQEVLFPRDRWLYQDDARGFPAEMCLGERNFWSKVRAFIFHGMFCYLHIYIYIYTESQET